MKLLHVTEKKGLSKSRLNGISWTWLESYGRIFDREINWKFKKRADFDWADDDVRDLEILNIDTKLCKIQEEPEEKEKPKERKNRSPKSPAKSTPKKLNENRSKKSTQKSNQHIKCIWLTPEETNKGWGIGKINNEGKN